MLLEFGHMRPLWRTVTVELLSEASKAVPKEFTGHVIVVLQKVRNLITAVMPHSLGHR
jgi:hypothetical protein